MRIHRRRRRHETGFSLVELMVVTVVLGMVVLVVSSVLMTSSKAESKTVRRAKVQGDTRQAMFLMTTEIRQAGADPANPPIGLVGLAAGDDRSIHIRADLNGNGVLETAEPSEDITYAWDSTAKVITRNPGSGAAVVDTNVTAMQFTYFDNTGAPVVPTPLSAVDASRVVSIGLSMTALDKDSQPVTLTARIALRNIIQ
ncbi:MAG: prepilin-type N-terminal cleavage/methylation domain-containing protein [Candidatus Eiseniibacteriota bacterium]